LIIAASLGISAVGKHPERAKHIAM
jgi:hypothetical protein